MKVITLNELTAKRKVQCLEIPHYAYTRPLCAMRKQPTHIQGHLVFAVIPVTIGAIVKKPKEPIFLTHARTDQQEKERKAY